MKHIVKLPGPSINGQDTGKKWSNCHFLEDTVLCKSPKKFDNCSDKKSR